MVTKKEIIKVARKIGKACLATRVILFGSYARGDANEYSDIDLLIVANSDLPRFKRTRKLYKLFKPYPFSMDLLMYTPEEVEKQKKIKVSFISQVLKEGTVVYG